MSDFPISCQGMWQETPVCHGDNPWSHLSRWDPPACCSKETSTAQGVPGGPWGHRSALLLANAPGQLLDSVKHHTASSARPIIWLWDCSQWWCTCIPAEVRLTPMPTGLGAANNSLMPRADFLWQVRLLTLCLSLPFCCTGMITHACLTGW